MIAALGTALRTLTVLPVPGRDAHGLSQALVWFPVVGAGLGGIEWAMAHLLARVGAPLSAGVTAWILLLAGVALTGALHLDGLADWSDGFFGGTSRDSRLAIMKDPRTGSFGVTAIALSLLGRWVALSSLVAAGGAALSWIAVAMTLSRTAQADLASRLPYARKEGTAAPFVANPPPFSRSIVLVLSALLAVALAGGGGLLAWIATVLGARFFGRACCRRLGGITGDGLGAASEIIETAVLVVGALLAPHLTGSPLAHLGGAG